MRDDGDPHRDQALAADARGLPVRRMTTLRRSPRHDRRRADRRVLRPGLAAGRARRVVARELSPRPGRVGGVARRRAVSLLAATRSDVEALARRPVPRQGEGDLGRATAFRAAPLLSRCSSKRGTCARTRRCACARRSSRGACPRSCPRSRSKRCSAAPDVETDARPARPRDARDAVRDRACACPSSSASSSRRCRSTWASCA